MIYFYLYIALHRYRSMDLKWIFILVSWFLLLHIALLQSIENQIRYWSTPAAQKNLVGFLIVGIPNSNGWLTPSNVLPLCDIGNWTQGYSLPCVQPLRTQLCSIFQSHLIFPIREYEFVYIFTRKWNALPQVFKIYIFFKTWTNQITAGPRLFLVCWACFLSEIDLN